MSTTPLCTPQSAREETPTILIIDDDPGCLNLARHMLSSSQCDCLCHQDIQGGWEALQTDPISVVIADLHVGAFALIELMRAHQRSATIPVIVATGDDRAETARTIRAQGARLIYKPFSSEELIACVRQCLTDKQA